MISDTIFENLMPLLHIKDSKIKKLIDDFLPFSTGFEVECDRKDSYDIQCFQDIPNIMEVASTHGEERFRVPSGLKGLICIWMICEQLEKNCLLSSSGTHIHVDFTDCYHILTNDIVKLNEKWMLEELDTWNYPGSYNKRGVNFCSSTHESYMTGNWIRYQYFFKTLEFRICEMTFDYPVLIKRIIHANDIVRKLKISLLQGIHQLELINLQNQLKEMRKKEEEDFLSQVSYSDIAGVIVKSRVKRV